MFQWYDGNAYTMFATIYHGNITLNKQASVYLENNEYCLLGFDEKSKMIAIKGCDMKDVELKLVDITNLNKLSKSKSYTRISNKSFNSEISKFLDIKFDGEKFKLSYDEKERMLVINLNEPLNQLV